MRIGTAQRSPRVGSKRKYVPVGMDLYYNGVQKEIEEGTIVRVIQPHGCPKNGTMGMCYVEVADTKEFVGLVNIASLEAVK